MITIVIPVYNVQDFIMDCLMSVMNQSCVDGLQCILVDDCGQDNSIEIAERLIAGYTGDISFSIHHHPKNKGLSGARNTGIQAALGDYIYFLDSDDILYPNCIELISKPLTHRYYDLIIGDYDVINGEDVNMHLSMKTGEVFGRDSIAEAKRKNRWYPMVWGKLYRRQFLLDNNLFFCEGILNEDELFSSEVACVAESMYCIPDVKSYQYRIRENSIMTSSIYEKRKVSCERILGEMYSFLVARGMDKVSVCNDLLYALFSYANEVSWRYSRKEYNNNYAMYRSIINHRYGERICADKRLSAFVRDIHFLLPPCLGRYLFRLMIFESRLMKPVKK